MFVFMDAMEDADELRSIPTWKPRLMTGDRKGMWSLNVTRNWRITFRIDADEKEICEVNFEDYHTQSAFQPRSCTCGTIIA